MPETLNDCWLSAAWSFVRPQLPPPPARVLEVGCGPVGGFVPALRGEGYEATGIDPHAPDSAEYQRVEFEQVDGIERAEALVASTSLHHVGDPDLVLDQVAAVLVPGGRLVVIEWAWERFDAATARWCFARLAPSTGEPDHPGWLHHHRDRWTDSGRPWDTYLGNWAKDEGLHRGDRILRALDARFDRTTVSEGPYFFCDLADTSAADEQAAIDAGDVQATCLRYAGTT